MLCFIVIIESDHNIMMCFIVIVSMWTMWFMIIIMCLGSLARTENITSAQAIAQEPVNPVEETNGLIKDSINEAHDLKITSEVSHQPTNHAQATHNLITDIINEDLDRNYIFMNVDEDVPCQFTTCERYSLVALPDTLRERGRRWDVVNGEEHNI